MQAEKPDCRNCVQLYGEGKTPCDKCLPYNLMAANEEAYSVYVHVRGNLDITATGQVLDVRKEALTATIIGLEVENKKIVFEKVSILMRHLISEDLI